MAIRAARELPDRSYVNLGIGMPTTIANYIDDDSRIISHSENGMMALGRSPAAADIDADIINAGKEPVSEKPETSYFSSADSFAMIRGGHIDVAVLGGMQVAANGDLANWKVPGRVVKGVGGAMDLVTGAKKIIILMDHHDKNGQSKVVSACALPLTGSQVVDMVITNLGVFAPNETHFKIAELAPNVDIAYIKANTQAELKA